MKYKEWLHDWLELYEKESVKPRTYKQYEDVIEKRLIPALGDYEMENELAATVYYDVLNYDGSLAGWEEVIAVYAVKLNLDSEDPQEVATFDESKANALRTVFLDMHDLSLMSETHTRYETRQETDANGNVVEVTEEINTVYVTIITTPKSAAQIAEEYGFTAQQKEMLTELLSSENAELWAGILSE